MLQAHSLLWHYLWVAPNVYLFALGILLWRRGRKAQTPAFIAFALLSAAGELAVYSADVIPSVSGPDFWRVDWLSLSIGSVVKFFVIGEVFSRLFDPYPSVSKIGKYLVSSVGAVLLFIAALIAALSPGDSTYRLISGAHRLELTVYFVETGLIVIIFLIAANFHMPWDRSSFGILLGFGISSCIHLATWALIANYGLSSYQRNLLDFVNMGTYHVVVLIWCYYLLDPAARNRPSPPAGPADDATRDHEKQLKDWNRELERLIHQEPLDPPVDPPGDAPPDHDEQLKDRNRELEGLIRR